MRTWKEIFTYLKQFARICKWIKSVVEVPVGIRLELSKSYSLHFYLQPEGNSLVYKPVFNWEEVRFLICRPRKDSLPPEWIRIFSFPDLEVWERTQAHTTPTPLHWGLTEEEKRIALSLARTTLENFLKDNSWIPSLPKDLPPRFSLKADVDVALWVSGKPRGSQIVESRPLGEAIVLAALKSARDYRFKPLLANELADTRIEIALLQTLRLPLTLFTKILPEKGYLLTGNGHRGWYLPAVLNVRRFQNLNEFLTTLAVEKAGIPSPTIGHVEIRAFEVDDFIESSTFDSLPLRGPVILKQLPQNFPPLMFSHAAEWLCGLQQPDGNIPPVVHPDGEREPQVRWSALAFSAWALAKFGQMTGEPRYMTVARKSYAFLNQYLPHAEASAVSLHSFIYFGRLASTLGELHSALATGGKLLNGLREAKFEPILFGIAAHFMKSMGAYDEKLAQRSIQLFHTLREEFEYQHTHHLEMSLAGWAEVANAFFEKDPVFAKKICHWLVDQQLPSGAFPNTTRSDFQYSRGTSKIFEILTLWPDENHTPIKRALSWLHIMQYDEENCFFVNAETMRRLIGGFRHDMYNPDAWIDAAGHVLLGASRLKL